MNETAPENTIVSPSSQAPVVIQQPKKRTGMKILILLIGVALTVSLFYNAVLFTLVRFYTGSPMVQSVIKNGAKDEVVAVYQISGPISGDTKNMFSAFYNTIIDNKRIKAIVIRVDTPGGTVAGSTQIHHLVEKIKESGRKVVVSMGGVAASGGYMISAPADKIYAEKCTITGSIGVIAVVPNIHNTMEKLGIRTTTIKSSHAEQWKDRLSPLKKEINETEVAAMKETLDKIQIQFENTVRDGRGHRLKLDNKGGNKVPVQFTGKTFMADEALELGLIDEIGFIDDAITDVAKMAKLKREKVVYYSNRTGFMSMLRSQTQSGVNIDMKLIDQLQVPRILMTWQP